MNGKRQKWHRWTPEERKAHRIKKEAIAFSRQLRLWANQELKRLKDATRKCVVCLKYSSHSYPVTELGGQYCRTHNPDTPRCEGPGNKQYPALTRCHNRVRPPNRFCGHHKNFQPMNMGGSVGFTESGYTLERLTKHS